jgi:tRNA(Ile)-lysidine synthase
MLEKGDSVLVALSGGADSVALLHLILALKKEYKLKLGAAHLDHAMRKDSSKDRQFCRTLCAQLRARHALPLRFHSKRIEVSALARRRRLSLEEAGRQARYEYFESLAAKYGYDKIATGHTLDDNVETIIFNIVRGSGMSGLAGIPFKRDTIIRPLLEIEKRELLDYLTENKISFRHDPSNDTLAYSRNRIRNVIMPELEKLNPRARRNIARLSNNISEELEYIRASTVSAYNLALLKADKTKIVLDLELLERYHKSLAKKVLEEAFKGLSETSIGLSSNALDGCLRVLNGSSGGKHSLSPGYFIEKSSGKVAIVRVGAASRGVRLKIPGKTEVSANGIYLKSSVRSRKAIGEFDKSNRSACLDMSKIKYARVRFWNSGDKIRPLGMTGHRLLSDIFIDKGVPEFERRSIPLVLSGKTIAWIAGIMISDDFKITGRTEKVLTIELCGP